MNLFFYIVKLIYSYRYLILYRFIYLLVLYALGFHTESYYPYAEITATSFLTVTHLYSLKSCVVG